MQRKEKDRIRCVWYRASNEFSNKRASALCPVSNTIMAIYPLSIDNCFFSFLKHRSIDILSISFFASRSPDTTAPMGLLFISLLLGEPDSILRTRTIQPGDYFEKISSPVSVRYTVACFRVSGYFLNVGDPIARLFHYTTQETGCFFFGPSELSKLWPLAFIDSHR